MRKTPSSRSKALTIDELVTLGDPHYGPAGSLQRTRFDQVGDRRGSCGSP